MIGGVKSKGEEKKEGIGIAYVKDIYVCVVENETMTRVIECHEQDIKR